MVVSQERPRGAISPHPLWVHLNYNILRGVCQVKKSIFWYLTLCTLLISASVNGWDVFLGIAVVSNAIVVLMDVAEKLRGSKADRR